MLVSLVSFTINTESVLNLRTTKTDMVIEPLCIAPVPFTPCDERCSVQCTWCNGEVLYVHSDDCHSSGMFRQQYDTSAVVSARAHGVCAVPYSYKFFLQVDALRTGLSLPVKTRNALQNKECLTEQRHPCSVNNWVHVHLYLMLFFGGYCAKQFFLQTDSLQTHPKHQNGQSLAKPNECDPSVLQLDDGQH